MYLLEFGFNGQYLVWRKGQNQFDQPNFPKAEMSMNAASRHLM
jgi:hypothetical protein